MRKFLPLHACHVWIPYIIISRVHGIFHFIAIAFLVYYRASFLFRDPETIRAPNLLWLLVSFAELLLSFVWILGQAYHWHPVSRTVFPERLTQEDEKLPAIDVFICTTDPKKEPTLDVMNTVLSAMALDYPAEKLHVFLSDDAGAEITLCGTREAWRFARYWIPFCNKFRIKTTCPKVFFLESEDCITSTEFAAAKRMVQEKYEAFKERLSEFGEDLDSTKAHAVSSKDHPAVIEVMENYPEERKQDHITMPMLVYVSREKKTWSPHHFKAGALNVLDCDMYCNDSSSARQAMCFHLDQELASSLAFVQFPQIFHNISDNDIYDSQLRSAWKILWPGLDGLNGPVLSGTGFYIKRKSLYGDFALKGCLSVSELKQSFGSSNEFVKSLSHCEETDSIRSRDCSSLLLKEGEILASSSYEKQTQWGEDVGFLYQSVAEDVFTGFKLHSKGWKSVYLNPSRPQFLGASITNLNDLFIQGTRWSSGLVEVGLSTFFSLICGTSRMSFLQGMCYAEISLFPLCYCFSLWCFGTIPQLCLVHGISLYPEVSSPYFLVFAYIFLSAVLKQLYEVYTTGGSITTWLNEQRLWMMKSVSTHTYGSLDAIMKKMGLREASFIPTNKAEDFDKSKLYQMGKFDFETSPALLVPMVVVVIMSMVSLVLGLVRIVKEGRLDALFAQIWISFYIVLVNYAVIEGMVIRKDRGCIPSSITLLSSMISMIFFLLVSVCFIL